MIPSILVIGPDRVGKTTVVSHISRKLGLPSFKCPAEKRIFKLGGRDTLAFDYTLTHFLNQTRFRFISDRAYPCEWVYSKVFGRETDEELLKMIDEMHETLNTKILYLYSSVAPSEEDDLVPSEKYWDVKNTYDEFCKWTRCEVTAMDTAKMLKAFEDGGDISDDFADECIVKMGID